MFYERREANGERREKSGERRGRNPVSSEKPGFSPLATRHSRLFLIGAVACGALLVSLAGTPTPSAAQTGGEVVPYTRIEEDWELEILDPDNVLACPHVATQMSPHADSPVRCNFKINHRELSSFAAGGLQAQLWRGRDAKAFKSYGTAVLNTVDEKITWTQYMQRNNNGHRLIFGISKGTSTTWGNLATAGIEAKYKQYNDGDLDTEQEVWLSGYSSDYSLKHSGVTFGAQRVKSLKLVQVRKYRFDGVLGQLVFDLEATPRLVWGDSGP